ncbi:hypothetical protein GCM10007079_24920 [Nocardiopsis terrae]|nr:hypothetical protein GCM10007079_24920 [Nocardiopsis terrae]
MPDEYQFSHPNVMPCAPAAQALRRARGRKSGDAPAPGPAPGPVSHGRAAGTDPPTKATEKQKTLADPNNG